MSNQIIDLEKQEPVYVNDVGRGRLMIGDFVFNYSDLLPVIAHYITGGIMGYPVENEIFSLGMGLPEKELKAIRDFITEIKSLVEVRDKVGISAGNFRFIPKNHLSKRRKPHAND